MFITENLWIIITRQGWNDYQFAMYNTSFLCDEYLIKQTISYKVSKRLYYASTAAVQQASQ